MNKWIIITWFDNSREFNSMICFFAFKNTRGNIFVSRADHPYMQMLCKMRQVRQMWSWSSECSRRRRTPTHNYWNRAKRSWYKALCLLITGRDGHTCLFFFRFLLLLTSRLLQPRTDRVTLHASPCLRLLFQYLWYFVGNLNPCQIMFFIWWFLLLYIRIKYYEML